MALAGDRPWWFLSIIMDGMDNKKTCVPMQATVTKEVDGAGIPINSQLIGVLMPWRGFYGAITLPNSKHGSSLTCSIYLRALLILEKMGRAANPSYTLPPIVHIQVDNCGRENKNQQFLAFNAMLIELGVFRRVDITYLNVGHTHCQIDQAFSVVHNNLHHRDVFTVPKLVASVQTLFQTDGKFNVCEEVTDVLDVDAMKKGLVHELAGLGTCHDFETGKKMSVKALRLEKPPFNPAMRASTSSYSPPLNCGLMFKVREEGGWDGDDCWRGHWLRPSEPIQVFKPD